MAKKKSAVQFTTDLGIARADASGQGKVYQLQKMQEQKKTLFRENLGLVDEVKAYIFDKTGDLENPFGEITWNYNQAIGKIDEIVEETAQKVIAYNLAEKQGVNQA